MSLFWINGGKMIKSKGWDWKIVKDDIVCPWKIPSVESYYLLNRWENLNFKNFLDLGCGLGRHTVLFAKNGFNVSGFDISKEGIRKTKEWLKNLDLKADLKVAICLNFLMKMNILIVYYVEMLFLIKIQKE